MSDHLSPGDEELVRRIERQDQTALAVLYERYGNQVYSLAYRVLQNPQLAEEATQDTFMKVWRRAARWDAEKGRFSSWMLTIARYTAIDLLRSEQRQSTPETTALDDITPPESDQGIPHDPMLQNGRLLRELLHELPFEQSQVIQMAFFEGLTHRDLADKLDLPLGTIKTRVRLGLQKLRSRWAELMQSQEL